MRYSVVLLHLDCDGSSPRGSPPGGAGPAGATAPIREEEEGCGRAAELLFSSPSMPNISLGRPHQGGPRLQPPPPQPAPHPHTPVAAPLAPVSEAEGWAGVGPARLSKRPLGRTHSAPLPLGDPALAPLAPPTAHHYLRDQIRKTVHTAILFLYNSTLLVFDFLCINVNDCLCRC